MFSFDASLLCKGLLLSVVFSSEINMAWAFPSANLNARQSSLPVGWSSLGSYTDSTSRTLRTAAYTSVGSMTIESCIIFCTPAGYQYAGIEYGRECYCDNTIHSPGAQTDAADCNMPCTGNPTEICGAGDRINIYTHEAATTSTSASHSSSTSSIATSTSSSGSSSTPITSTSTTVISTGVSTPTPTIVHRLGTWDYKGCYVDIGPRLLSQQINTITGGVTVESCTVACKSAGYGLSGLEYGQECWCDNYLPYGDLAPDTECNIPCKANTTELCGAGNRLAVYQDSSAIPISPDKCITGRGFFNFQLQAVPLNSAGGLLVGGVKKQIYAVTLNFNLQDTVQYTILSTCNNCPYSYFNFAIDNAIVTPNGLFGQPEPVAPVVGSAQVFIGFSATSIIPYSAFCAKPNPVSPNGTFIGFPALSVSDHADKWALCKNTMVVWTLCILRLPLAWIIHFLDVRMWCCRCRSRLFLISRELGYSWRGAEA